MISTTTKTTHNINVKGFKSLKQFKKIFTLINKPKEKNTCFNKFIYLCIIFTYL